MPVLDTSALIANRVAAIREYHLAAGVERAQIDVSGGLDSAVLVGLLARALGPQFVTAVHSRIDSNPEHLARAQEVCDAFAVALVVIDLTAMYHDLVDAMVESLDTAGFEGTRDRVARDATVLGSIRSCLRAPVGRGFNRLTGGGIRHGTGNECEDRWLRFYQKGGDGEVDTNPIAMLSKGEVFQLARALGVPRSVLVARPSPDLWGSGDAHNDEDEIGAYMRLGSNPGGHTFYSYIDPDTGAYTHVGLIERVSRFCDDHEIFDEGSLATVLVAAREHDAFRGVLPDEVLESLLAEARRVERVTRHKLNPNCPSLGDRRSLGGILTDALPEV